MQKLAKKKFSSKKYLAKAQTGKIASIIAEAKHARAESQKMRREYVKSQQKLFNMNK